MQQKDQKPIIIGNYIQKDILGRGSQGSVYRMVNMMNSQEYAAKVFDKNLRPMKTLKMEFEILLKCMKFNNENIVKFYELIQTNDSYILILEKCDSDLRKILQQGMNEEKVLNYLKQIVNGIQLLHSIKISHRDLKPGNILIKGDKIKIADLGLGCLQEESGLLHCSQALGTVGYMAPEVKESCDFNPKVADMYSLGIIFRELLYGRQSSIQSSGLDFKYSNQIREEINDLVKKMTEKDPLQRLQWYDLIQFLEKLAPQPEMISISTYYLGERNEKVEFFLELYEKIQKLNHGQINFNSPSYIILKVAYLELKYEETELTNIQNQEQMHNNQMKQLQKRINSLLLKYNDLYNKNLSIKFEQVTYKLVMKEELQNQYKVSKHFNENLKFILKWYFQELNQINYYVNTPQLILEVKCQVLVAINYGLIRLQEFMYGELKHNDQKDILTDMVIMAKNKQINIEEIERNLN